MKKIFTIVSLLVLTTIAVNAQTTSCSQQEKTMNAYVSAGSTALGSQLVHGLEVGCYTQKTWFAFTVGTQKFSEDFQIGGKMYRKLKALESKTDLYAYTGVSVPLESTLAVSLEPGLAMVYNFAPYVALQANLSTQSTTNFSLGQNYPIMFGLSFNYFFGN